VDTGFDEAFSENSWGHVKGLIKESFRFDVEKGRGIEKLLAERNINIKRVFCTHFHEHQGGAPSLPNNTTYIFGKGEKDFDFFPLMYSRFLKDKEDIQSIDFEKAQELPIVGKAVDIFGDGSFWAISTPGHTKGHISYFLNGQKGQYMLLGDICMCKKGYDIGIESGGAHLSHIAENKKSFQKIKKFLDSYPKIKPIFGHDSKDYKIIYNYKD
jgi:N-acyl homoserine lactone hydrolase